MPGALSKGMYSGEVLRPERLGRNVGINDVLDDLVNLVEYQWYQIFRHFDMIYQEEYHQDC